MKKLSVLVVVLVFCLALVGCSKEESEPAGGSSSTSAPAEKTGAVQQAEQAVKQTTEKVKQAAQEAGQKVKQATEEAGEKVAEVTEQSREKVTEMADQAKSKTQSLLASAQGAVADSSGQTVYSKNCASCHKSGVLGAPKVGDKEVWAPLIEEGVDDLTANAINGIGKMPAKGGNAKLTDSEVKAAVGYMMEQSR